jgi:hypothetical protein
MRRNRLDISRFERSRRHGDPCPWVTMCIEPFYNAEKSPRHLLVSRSLVVTAILAHSVTVGDKGLACGQEILGVLASQHPRRTIGDM